MQFVNDLRRLIASGPEGLDFEESRRLWGAILDGSLDAIEVGAVVGALASRGETREELLGLHAAATERLARWAPPLRARPICIAAFGMVPGEARIVALAARLLRRHEVPVVVHGVLDSPCGVSSASVLRELAILPCATAAQAAQRLAEDGVAFVPVQLSGAAFASLVGLRARLGVPNTAHVVAQALDPSHADAVALAFCAGDAGWQRTQCMALAAGGEMVALHWARPADSRTLALRPRIEHFQGGAASRLFEADEAGRAPEVPAEDAGAIAHWVEAVCEGVLPMPAPVVNLLAACLFATGIAASLSEAKAMAALQAARRAA